VATVPQKNLETIKRALGETFLDLRIHKLTLQEDLDEKKCRIHVVCRTKGSDQEIAVDGVGVGVVDAIFSGLLERFAAEYQSLKSIKLSGFNVQSKIETKQGKIGADAVGEVQLEVTNSEGKRFSFSDSSRSIVASAAVAVLIAVEYFVNAERAFVALHKALKTAQERGRPDLVQRYTRELAEVVESTSYAEIIERIRKEL